MLYKRETGRSMVEMLGVLAIIGVLSVAGIQGYSLAMAKHRANNAAQDVSIARIELETAGVMGNQDRATVELPNGSAVTVEGNSTYAQAGMRVDFGNDKAACKQFAAMYKDDHDYAVVVDCDS